MISASHILVMTALFLHSLHNEPLSEDAVRAELDFVHCGSCPLSGMERLACYLAYSACLHS